jgi:transcription termination factor Rho
VITNIRARRARIVPPFPSKSGRRLEPVGHICRPEGRIFVSETTEQAGTTTSTRTRRGGGEGLSGMVLTDLKAMASQLGIKGTSALRKDALIAAITSHQSGAGRSSGAGRVAERETAPAASTPAAPTAPAPTQEQALPLDLPERPARRRSTRAGGAPVADGESTTKGTVDTAAVNGSGSNGAANGHSADSRTETRSGDSDGYRRRADGAERVPSVPIVNGVGDQVTVQLPPADGDADRDGNGDRSENRDNHQGDGDGRNSRRNRRGRRDRDRSDNRGENRDGRSENRTDTRTDTRSDDVDNDGGQNRQNQGGQNPGRGQQNQNQNDDEDGQGRRRGRYRDRNRRNGRERFADVPDSEVRDDDVLVPVAGIVDVLDSYAFVRTSGYLSGPNDVYVSLSQVRKYGLRRGDAITGAVRAPREGEQSRQKFNALIRLDSVNGLDPDSARQRPEFTKLTPLYPNERLRLETESHILTTRVIDLVMPVGKGQRALIVSPPKAGKTSVLQAIANAISVNNPECHLMVVLVDERPEEVTDMQRSVKGEVIASTFDRPPADHTMVAELSIERAKRLVEMGKDVVVLLDSITRLGRAYNLAAPASGRILSGGVDSTALFPPKRFLGAARNIENGGSLTIFASALVETGSAGDTVIFEEFKGTGNAELKLDRKLADKRMFPAIDVDQSSTRKEDLLLSPDELAIVVKLRRVLSALDTQQALELVLSQLRKTRTNVEFLMQVAKNTPGGDRD